MIVIPTPAIQAGLNNGPIKPNRNKSSNAISISSQPTSSNQTPWTDANWDNLTSDEQTMQNAMQYKYDEYKMTQGHKINMQALKEAGLNPILAANFSGIGGSTPSFSNSSSENEDRNATNILSTAVSILAMVLLKGKK